MAIVGATPVAGVHASDIGRLGGRARVVAAVDAERGRLFGFAERWAVPRLYYTLENLLACEQPDIIDLCTPVASRAGQAVACLRRGATVLSEAPPVHSLAEMDAIAEAESAGGGRFVTVFPSRCDAEQRLRRLAGDASLGPPVTAVCQPLDAAYQQAVYGPPGIVSRLPGPRSGSSGSAAGPAVGTPGPAVGTPGPPIGAPGLAGGTSGRHGMAAGPPPYGRESVGGPARSGGPEGAGDREMAGTGEPLGGGIHQLELLLSVLGPWRQVVAVAAGQAGGTVPAAGRVPCALVTFDSGAVATVVTSVLSGSRPSRLRFDFAKATIELTQPPVPDDEVSWTVTATPGHEEAVLRGSYALSPGRSTTGYGAQLTRILDAVEAAGRPPVCVPETRATLELATAIYASAHADRPVRRGEIRPGSRFYHRMDGGEPVRPQQAASGAAALPS